MLLLFLAVRKYRKEWKLFSHCVLLMSQCVNHSEQQPSLVVQCSYEDDTTNSEKRATPVKKTSSKPMLYNTDVHLLAMVYILHTSALPLPPILSSPPSTDPNCAFSCQILSHWKNCQWSDCPVCWPLKHPTTNQLTQQRGGRLFEVIQ